MGLTKKELVEYVRIAEHNQEAAEEALNQQAENVKDWIPVVRCKDCKYKFSVNGHDKKGCPLDGVGLMNDDDFCSCGERRINNES